MAARSLSFWDCWVVGAKKFTPGRMHPKPTGTVSSTGGAVIVGDFSVPETRTISGYLEGVWLEIFGPVFPGFPADTDPRDPPRSPGPAPDINFHEKSVPLTNSKATW